MKPYLAGFHGILEVISMTLCIPVEIVSNNTDQTDIDSLSPSPLVRGCPMWQTKAVKDTCNWKILRMGNDLARIDIVFTC